MVDLQVHLRQRLVHVLHVLTGRCDQFVPVPQYGPHSELGPGEPRRKNQDKTNRNP
jgi:hypothetical protein